MHFKVFKEAKKPQRLRHRRASLQERRALARLRGDTSRSLLGAQRSARGRLQAARLFLLATCFSMSLFSLSFSSPGNRAFKLFNSPYIGKSPLPCFPSSHFLWKVSPFPRGSKETGESSKRTRAAGPWSPLALLEGRPVGDLPPPERQSVHGPAAPLPSPPGAPPQGRSAGRKEGRQRRCQLCSWHNIFLQIK